MDPTPAQILGTVSPPPANSAASLCPQCHTAVRQTDFFCFNCGKNLRQKPLSTGPATISMYYIGAVVLPPLGIVWGLKYLRENSDTAKTHGILLIGITIIELIVLTVWSVQLVNTVQSQVSRQLYGMPGL